MKLNKLSKECEISGLNYIDFPDVFITGKIPENATKKEICGWGLLGWGNCHRGMRPPLKFGDGMFEIYEALGIDSPEELLNYAEILKNRLNKQS